MIQPIEKQSPPKSLKNFDFFFAPAILLIIILMGHYGLFFGDTFFIDEDPVTVSGYHANDKQASGWRAEYGLGMTYLFADPGSQHSWSLFRWWHQLFSDDVLAYSLSVLILMWAACVAQFAFLRYVIPSLNPTVSLLLSSLIVFSPIRYEMFFIRSSAMMPISAVLVAWVLRKSYENPHPYHYFSYTLVMSITLLVGSAACLLQAIFFSIVFFFIQISYQYFHEESKDFFKPIKNYIILNICSGVSIFILGGWTFYSIFLEALTVGYVRDPDYVSGSFFTSLSIKFVAERILLFLHAGLLSSWSAILGIGQKVSIHSFNYVSALFPVIFLFIVFYKIRNFWEFSAKYLVLCFLFYMELCIWVPGFIGVIQSTINLHPPLKMSPFIMGFEIMLIAVFIDRIGAGDISINWTAKNFSRIAVWVISPIYLLLFSITLLAMMTPKFLNDLSQSLLSKLQGIIGSEEKFRFLSSLIGENIKLFNETMGWSHLFFYGTTFVFLVLLTLKIFPQFIRLKNGYWFAFALLANAIFLSWAVYPLNKEPLIWKEQKIGGIPLSETFEPTDRFIRVYAKPCSGHPDYLDCISKKFFSGEYGPQRYRVGYTRIPSLEFSVKKSYSHKEAAEFIDAFMGFEGIPLKGVRRYLQNTPSIHSSRLFDLAAVNYVLSADLIPEKDGLELIYKNVQFYLYKNTRAWPYFYFAEQVEKIKSFSELYKGKQGVGYVWEKDINLTIPAKLHDPDSQITLDKFKSGEMEFQYKSKENELLIISDSWHPNWHAQINGEEVKLIKANGIFKGVFLPPGSHQVRLFFDSSNYLPGVWISVFGWSFFLGTWFWMARRNRKKNSAAF